MPAHVERSVLEYPPELDAILSSIWNVRALDTYVCRAT